MRGANVDGDVNLLADGVLLHVVGVVVVLVTLAKPDVAGRGVEVGLAVGDLELTLDVAVVVAHLVVVHLLATGVGHGRARHTRAGAEDETVSADESDHRGRSHDLGNCVLHFEVGWLVLILCVLYFVVCLKLKSTGTRETESK